MKKTLLFGLALYPAFLSAQTDSWTVQGKVGALNAPAKVYLMYSSGEDRLTDSAVFNDGQFSFKGTVAEPVPGILVLDSKGVGLANINPNANPDVLRFYLEKGTIAINSKDSLSKAIVAGKTNGENQQLKTALQPVEKKMAALNDEFRAAPPEKKSSQDYVAEMQKKYEALTEEQNVVLRNFVQQNPTSYVSLSAIRNIAGPSPEPSEIEPLINSLSPELKNSASLKPLLTALESAKKTAIGSPAIDFTQNDPEGKPVKLSDFKGKYVLIDFWASWCGPCRQENPNVVKAYNQYKDKNFTILGVSLDRENGKEAWLKAIKDDGLEWTQVSDLQFWKNDVAVKYGVQSIPQNFLIDPQGRIIAKNLRGAELESKLAELL